MQARQHGQVGDHEARVRLGLRAVLRYVGESPALWIPLGMMVLVARCRSTSRCCCRCWRARRGAARGHLCRADRGDGRRLGGRRPGAGGGRGAVACVLTPLEPTAIPGPRSTTRHSRWSRCWRSTSATAPTACSTRRGRRSTRGSPTSRHESHRAEPAARIDLFGERLSNASPKIVDTGPGHCAEHKRISVAAGLSVWIINALSTALECAAIASATTRTAPGRPSTSTANGRTRTRRHRTQPARTPPPARRRLTADGLIQSGRAATGDDG
jgi:hypothetical protein